MFLIIILSILLLILLLFAYKIFAAKNYLALAMLIPYGVVLMLYLIPQVDTMHSASSITNKMQIDDMHLIRDITIEETVAIVMRSKITFGDGLQCAGGLINPDSTIEKILKSRTIPVKNMTIIWLLNSKASRLSVQGSILFVSDQRKAESGIWVGWVDSKQLSNIKKMDGVNL
jgi:hypothetical protein